MRCNDVFQNSVPSIVLRILEIAVAVLLAFWVLGLVFRLLGALIHIALIVAVILLIVRLMQGARRTV